MRGVFAAALLVGGAGDMSHEHRLSTDAVGCRTNNRSTADRQRYGLAGIDLCYSQFTPPDTTQLDRPAAASRPAV